MNVRKDFIIALQFITVIMKKGLIIVLAPQISSEMGEKVDPVAKKRQRRSFIRSSLVCKYIHSIYVITILL